MFNQMSDKERSTAIQRLGENSGFVVSSIMYDVTNDSLHRGYAAPLMIVYYPVSRDISNDRTDVVGMVTLEMGLESLFEDVLQGFEDEPVTAVVSTSCGSKFSFLIRGEQVTFLGGGDLHEDIPDVGEMELLSSTFQQFDNLIQSFAESGYPSANGAMCSYRLQVFPTEDFHAHFLTNRPLIIEALVGLVFLFTVAVFLGYDCLVGT